MPPRNLLCLITSGAELANVDEMTRDIWTHFDGICAVVHRQGADTEAVLALLRARAGGGFVVEADWIWHHGQSMSRWLLDPRIRAMDMCWIRDSSERFNPRFTRWIGGERTFTGMGGLSAQLLHDGIWNLHHDGKFLAFRRWYGQQVVNGQHWGVMGLHGATATLDGTPGVQYEDGVPYAYSVRAERRPPDHRIRHEVLYLLDYGLNGNHLALFHRGPADLEAAYARLAAFTAYLAERGVVGVDQYTDWLRATHGRAGGLPPEVKGWINEERPFRNHLRYTVLGHTHEAILVDEDTWRMA